ncbi:MAG: DUF6644 family protein, partial [Terracidiphilus sp.]
MPTGKSAMEISNLEVRRRWRARVMVAIALLLPLLATLALSRVAFAQTGGPPKPGETPFFTRFDNSYIGSSVRDSNWLFPVIESIHVVGIVFLVGASVLLDLRLLNRGYLRHLPFRRVWSQLLPVMWTAFGVMIVTGTLMLVSESWQCYTSVAFRVKMALLLAVGANVLFFYFFAYRRMLKIDGASPRAVLATAGAAKTLGSHPQALPEREFAAQTTRSLSADSD